MLFVNNIIICDGLLNANSASIFYPLLSYLDPGTASFIIQVLIAILVGGLFVVKLFWNNIKIFFKKLFGRGEKHEEK